MDKLGDRNLSERDIQMIGARSFVVGKLSSGDASFQEVEEATVTHMGISIADARFAIWTLADVGLVNGVLDKELSLAVHETQASGSADLVNNSQVTT